MQNRIMRKANLAGHFKKATCFSAEIRFAHTRDLHKREIQPNRNLHTYEIHPGRNVLRGI